MARILAQGSFTTPSERNAPRSIRSEVQTDLPVLDEQAMLTERGTRQTFLNETAINEDRFKNDLSIPFRKMYATNKAGELDYVAANSRTICANNGTFSALTFEDQDTMLVTSANKKRYNKKENESPLEKIIRI